MTEMIYISCITFLLLLSLILAYKLYKFSVVILKMEDALEESLDILNERYSKMNDILQTPVFFDSIEVRQVISEIKGCHDAIMVIANKLTYETGLKSETKEEEASNSEAV
jgi:uncharacterized membrane protein